MMVEAGANEVTEEEMLEAIMFAHDYIKELVELSGANYREVGKPKMEYIGFHS
jgi:polyribonucleotide nucleotidyltransferase